MSGPVIGKWLIMFAVVIAAVGGLFYFNILPGKLGHLPGDINVRKDGFSTHILIGTSIILSIVLTLIINLILRVRH